MKISSKDFLIYLLTSLSYKTLSIRLLPFIISQAIHRRNPSRNFFLPHHKKTPHLHNSKFIQETSFDMAAPNEDKYVAKYPLSEGGVIKSSGEPMSQQEWDEQCEEYYIAMLDFVCKKSRRLKELQQRHEEIFQQEEDKAMMEIGRYLVKLLIEKAEKGQKLRSEEEEQGTLSDSDEDTQLSS